MSGRLFEPQERGEMKIYNVVGYALLLLHAAVSMIFAPAWLGAWWGLLVGFSYLALLWFLCGVYLSDVLHMGVMHRTLIYPDWFVKTVTILNNCVGVYVGPVSWVNRHRHHHAFSDHDGDPN